MAGQDLRELLEVGLLKDPQDWLDDPGLIEAVRMMPPRRQAVLWLRFHKGLTQSECATFLQVNQKSVSRHEQVALKTLRLIRTSGKLSG